MRIVNIRMAGSGGYVEECDRRLDLTKVVSVWDYDGIESDVSKLIIHLVSGVDWIIGFDGPGGCEAFRRGWEFANGDVGPKVAAEPKVAGKSPGRPPGSKNKPKPVVVSDAPTG